MKQKLSRALYFSAMFFLSACAKESPENPSTVVSCTADYTTHPKNAQYHQLLDNYLAKGGVGMTLLVNHPTDGLWMGAAGYADLENQVKMTPCHLQHTASIYKTFVATVILQLAEEGKLSLDDKIDQYLPASITDRVPNGHKAGIRHLLQHRSGMPDVFESAFVLDFFNNGRTAYTEEELLAYVYGKKPLSEPGTDFYYSDANYVLLSLIINKLDGDCAAVIRKRIFEKIGAEDSWFIKDPSQAPAGLSASYWDRYNDGKLENVSDWQIGLTAGLRGTDGIICNASDMQKFVEALMKGQLISQASLHEMMDTREIPAPERKQGFEGYGLGLGQVAVSAERWYGHFGSHIGSGAIALYNPAHQTTLVVFQNKGTFFSDSAQQALFSDFIRDLELVIFQ